MVRGPATGAKGIGMYLEHTYPLKSGAIACNMSINKELGP
jgi:hypothetical protein